MSIPTDYEPLDLSAYCNAGISLYDPATYTSGGTYLEPRPINPPIGKQVFHGLPFLIGTDPPDSSSCLLGFGRAGLYQEAVTLSVNKSAYYVLFAHAVLETKLWQGGPLGVEIARYEFQYEDNISVYTSIRERFEIGNVPLPWGHDPFLCVPDQQATTLPRSDGHWQDTGLRQTEVITPLPQGYYIWVWKNPNPEKVIQAIHIHPQQQTFVIGGITLGYQDEYPLVKTPVQPIKITLLDSQSAELPFNLDVEIDRGVATYTYPLPATPLDKADPSMRGFGAPKNKSNSPAYAKVTGIPSATLKIKSDEQVIDTVAWRDLEAMGQVETSRVRIERIETGRNWVQVEVLDEATNQPIPCRVAFHSEEGIPYAPHGHHAPLFSNFGTWHIDVGGDVRLGQMTYAYIDGTCQGWLPRGKVLVDIARGYEYEPIRQWVQIKPGQTHLQLKLQRLLDMKAEGYYSADTHVHFLSVQGAMNEAQGEDLQVVNLLQSQWGHLYTNTEEFSGHVHESKDKQTLVYVSQENRQHILGHLSLLGLKSPVMPWGSGGPPEAELGGSLETTLSHWADAAHEQDALVIAPHFPTPNGEIATLIATGRADAVEMLDFMPFEHYEYYRYLNAGYRLPLVGGTDKMSSSTPVGLYRTYAYLPPNQEFTYASWCRAIQSGNTFVSGGALIWFKVDGKPIGSTLNIKGGGTVEIEARASSIFPLHTLQIVQQGRVIAETQEEQGSQQLSLNLRLKVKGNTWLAARCAGPDYTAQRHYDQRRRGIMAHTSPIYIACDDDYHLADAETIQYMLTLISGNLSYIRNHALHDHPDQVTHAHNLSDHIAYLEEPFRQALEMLHRRLHELGIPH